MPVVLVGDPVDLQLRGELRYGLELARLVCDPVFLHPEPHTDAPPVLLVPGFMAGDASLALLREWLRRRGSRTSSAGLRVNVDCAERTVGRVEVRLRELADDAGGRAVVIGQSRGGELARVARGAESGRCGGAGHAWVAGARAAERRAAHAEDAALRGAFGRPGGTWHVLHGVRRGGLLRGVPRGPACAAGAGGARGGDLFAQRRNRLVAARLDPDARHVEVESSHGGMSVNRAVYRVLAKILEEEPAWSG